MNTSELIQLAKDRENTSAAGIARQLKIARQTLDDWDKGRKPAPDRYVIELAGITGLDPAETIAEIHASRAPDETRKTWEEIARRARSSTALLVALVLATLLGSVGTAGKCYAEQVVRPNLYIMSSRQKRAGKRISLVLQWFAGLFGHPENLRFPTHGN